MSSNDEKKKPYNKNDLFDDVLRNQSKEFDGLSTGTVEESLPSVEELKSDKQLLSSGSSVRVSYQISSQSTTPSSQDSYVDQVSDTCSSGTIYSTQKLRNYKNCSGSDVVPPQENPTASTLIPKDSNSSGAKTNQRNLPPFQANLSSDFSSPPDRDPVPVIRSLSKGLKETNTPSPEKRSFETDVGSTPIKRLRKTPETCSDKLRMKSESNISKLSFSEATKTSYKSPTNLQLQELKVENKESLSLNSPSTPSKRKRNSSVEPKITNDLYLSHSMPSSSAVNTVRESPTNSPTLESEVTIRDVDNSATERKTLISFRDCSTDPNSLEKLSNPESLGQTPSFLTLPTEKYEFVSKNSSHAFSDKPYLKIRTQKCTMSISDNFTSKKPDSFVHVTSLVDAPLYESNDVSGKQKDRLLVPDALFDVEQSYLPVNEAELTVHPPSLADKASGSNYEPESNFKNSTYKDIEPCLKVKNMQGPSALNLVDKVIDSVHSVSHLKLEIDLSNSEDRTEQNRSDSTTLTLKPDRKLRSPPKDFSLGRRQGKHQRSLSDETLTHRISPEVPEKLQPSILCGPGICRRSASAETLTSENLSDVPSQQYQSNSLRNFQSNETSSSLPEISESGHRTTRLGQPVNLISPARSASDELANFREFIKHTSFNHYGHTDAQFFILPSTHEIMKSMTKLLSDLQSKKMQERSLSGETSTPRSQPEVADDINSPSIDDCEGQTSTSSQQPIITAGSSSYVQPSFPTTRNEDEFDERDREANSECMNSLEGSWRKYQPICIRSDDSSDELDSMSDSPSSPSDLPQSGDSDESISGTPDFPYLPRRHTEFIDQARLLLQSVMREMMLYNGEDDLWRKYEKCFRRISGSHSELAALKLHSFLLHYLVNKGYDLWHQNLFTTHEKTAETRTSVVYEKLLSLVVSVLAFTFKKAKSYDFYPLMHIIKEFRNLYARSVVYDTIIDVEDIQDEVSRNRVKARMKKIQSLMMRTLIPFRLLLMYIGENSNEGFIQLFEEMIWKEDRMFLRRRPT